MKKQLRIFLAGVMIVTPFAVAAYVVWWAGSGLDGLARSAIGAVAPGTKLFPGLGAIALLVTIYLIGWLTHWWVFRCALRLLERLFSRVPVVKSVYEGVRDVLVLFSGDAEKMGQVVRYSLPGTEIELLGIQTSTSPRGIKQPGKVAVYLPMSYMFGGPTVYVDADCVKPMDLSVEEALRIAVTAGAGGARIAPRASPKKPQEGEPATEEQAG